MKDKKGLLQRLFDKPQPEIKQTDATVTEKTYDYGVLPELAKILTNGNEQAISDIRLLAENVGAFIKAHRGWCDRNEMDYDVGADDSERHLAILFIFEFWLAGDPTMNNPLKDPPKFGALIDRKEATDNIIGLLSNADKNLGYGLELNQIKFDLPKSTGKALKMIDGFLSSKGLALCALDFAPQSYCYHLFVLRDEEYSHLTQLAERAGFIFCREFV
jgi:hypothetical protein